MSAINQRTPPFPLLALPKELRLKIYEEALCINKHPIRTNQHPSIPRKYHLIRRTTPGFYRPYTCQQMMSSPGGLYPGRVFHTVHPNAMPPITQVGGLVGKESLELFTKTKLLFELDDMHGMSAWNLVANAFLISSITTAHAIAPAMAIIESGQGSVPDRLWYTLPNCVNNRVELHEPIFKIQILKDGAELVLRSRFRLTGVQQTLAAKHATSRLRPLQTDHLFDGNDVIKVLRGIEDAVVELKRDGQEWTFLADPDQVVVSDELHLVDGGYLNLVVKIVAPRSV